MDAAPYTAVAADSLEPSRTSAASALLTSAGVTAPPSVGSMPGASSCPVESACLVVAPVSPSLVVAAAVQVVARLPRGVVAAMLLLPPAAARPQKCRCKLVWSIRAVQARQVLWRTPSGDPTSAACPMHWGALCLVILPDVCLNISSEHVRS